MKRLFPAVLALLIFSGCSPNAREPADLALARVLGVDGASPVTVMAVCGSANGQELIRGSCRGESLELALEQLPWMAEEEIGLTSVTHLVCGPDADLMAMLFAILEDRELGPSMAVWMTETDAAELLDTCPDPAAELELLVRGGIRAPTAVKTLGTLLMEGSVLLPLLAQEDGRLLVRGEVRWSVR